MPPPDPIEHVEAEGFGVKVKAASKDLNTLATVGGLIITAVVAVLLFFHMRATEADNAALRNDLTSAVKELTVTQREQITVAREQNCLMTRLSSAQSTVDREREADFCKRIAR